MNFKKKFLLIALMLFTLALFSCGKRDSLVAISTPLNTPNVTIFFSENPIATPSSTIFSPVTDSCSPSPNGIKTNLCFTPSAAFPIPSSAYPLPMGQVFHVGGTVSSDSFITDVTATIKTKNGSLIGSYSKSFTPEEKATTVELIDILFPKNSECLSNLIPFSSLKAGNYVFILTASDQQNQNSEIAKSNFSVVDSEWKQLIPNNLRNSYDYTIRFFGYDEDKFLFTYKWGEGRSVITNQKWVDKYITTVTAPDGKRWTVHKEAAPYFIKAFEYISTSYIRVSYAGGSSGIIPLKKLIKSFNGSYVSRFVSDRSFVSHHAFGTAADINASLNVYKNLLSNREVIYKECGENLEYNGISTFEGISYYDFTYSGNWKELYENIPTCLLNYLLYELAFYRAEFGWGFYYPHACDGMHFTVSELGTLPHESSEYSLKKVTQYCGE